MRRFLLATVASFFLACIQPAFCATPAPAPRQPAVAAKEKLPPPPPAEVLHRITAAAACPVIKTPQGYTAEVDRSRQVLSVSKPKKQVWISPRVEAHQTVEVITDNAPLQQDSTVHARLKKGRLLFVTADHGEWAFTAIVAGEEIKKGWVLKKHLKPVAEDRPPAPRLSAAGSSNFASAAMLIQKGKQFDDGLYAAVELAMQNGLGPITGKREWLPRLAVKADNRSAHVPLAQLHAAVSLGGQPAQLSDPLKGLMDQELTTFRADEKRSKPLGFYNWSPELESIFRQDRMLQSKLPAAENSGGILAIARALAADPEARASYEQTMRLNERLTNKLTGSGYRNLLASLDAGKSPQFSPQEEIAFFPSSRSHESDLVLKLYADKPVPAGFDLMKEVIARLKSGVLSFQPQADSGWYDHQLWSLESLVRFDGSDESSKLRPNAEYRKHLEELFKGTYAVTRETHVKQLDIPKTAMAAAPDGPPPKVREKIYLAPDPRVELLPTMYLRRARSYRFVREVLAEAFGPGNLSQLKRLTADGPVETSLAAELDQMEQLFAGAYVTACRELGLAEALPSELGAGQTADEQSQTFLRWVAALASDPDLAPDTRMMVPIFFDQQRRKLKVWLLIGWDSSQSSYNFAQHPSIRITDENGQPPPADEGPEIIFTSSSRTLATPVFAEVYVTRPLNRAEFRRHCDCYQTKAAILANLE